VLAGFAERHRGARLGAWFGAAAVYAGRRLAARVCEGGVALRLPDALARRETAAARGRLLGRRDARAGSWVLFVPRAPAEAARLEPLIEAAVRHAVERDTTRP